MGRCQNVAIVDQHPAAIKSVEVRQSGHPGKFVFQRSLAAYDAAGVVPDAARYTNDRLYNHIYQK